MEITKEMQKIELEIFKEVKRICQKYNIRYYAIGGTCLGAIRHSGFIPWDDDMDLVMPVQDYYTFIRVSQELQKPYALYGLNNMHWCGDYIKIVNENTTLVEQNCRQYPDRYEGVYIDIMPFYWTSDVNLLRFAEAFLCGELSTLNFYQRLPLNHWKKIKNKLIWMLNLPIKLSKGSSYYTDMIHKYFLNKSSDLSEMILFGWRKYHFPWSRFTYRNLFYYEDFSEPIELPFEDTSIFVPRGYDRYLKMDFGNYMALPPVEERITVHPTDILDLNRSYKLYRREIFGL